MLKKGWILIWTAALFLLTGCVGQERTIQVQQTESPAQVYADVAVETIEAKPNRWGNESKVRGIVSYEGFCGEKLVVVKEQADEKQIGFLDEKGNISWIPDVFSIISHVFLSGEYAVVETKEGDKTCLYLVSTQGEKTEIDCFATSEKVTDVSWSEDGRYFIYVIRQQDDYVGRVYDLEAREMQTYYLSNYLSGDLSWILDAITPCSITIAQHNYLAIQAMYKNDAYLISLKLPDQQGGSIDLGKTIVRRCSQGPVVCSQGTLYYIGVSGQLMALRQDGSGERTIASNANKVAISKQGENLAYIVRNASIDQIYVAKKQEGTAPKLVDIRATVKKIAFDDSGHQLMVQYMGRSESEQEQCVVLKIED